MSAALPVILGVLLVALAAAAALLPLLRGAPAQPTTVTVANPAEAERFQLYKQVLELEFDQQTGKLSSEDFGALSRELLSRAGELLHAGQPGLEPVAASPATDVEAEIEREIAAARKAFARARREQRETEEVAS